MAKKKGYSTKCLRSKGGVYSMNQVYEESYNPKKLSFLQGISLLGIWLIFLAPVVTILLFFVSLLVG
jgi:hypothetical protein